MKKLKFLFIFLLFAGCYYEYQIDDGQLKQNTLWPNGEIPFILLGFTGEETATITRAMIDWQLASGNRIHFHPVFFSKKDKVIFAKISSSEFGGETPYLGHDNHIRETILINGGLSAQELYVTATHEIGHILGLPHEFARPDRDIYINVNNAGQGILGKLQFLYFDPDTINYDYKHYPFDYDSIMNASYTPYLAKKSGKPLSAPEAISAIDGWKIYDMYSEKNQEFIK